MRSTARLAALSAFALAAAAPAFAAVTVRAAGVTAVFTRGAVTSLRGGGTDMATLDAPDGLAAILRTSSEHAVTDDGPDAEARPGSAAVVEHQSIADLPGASVRAAYSVDGGEIVVTQQADAPQPGMVGMQWGVTGVPYGYNVIVPGNGGIRIRRDSPGASWRFNYPIGWEAQLVIVEGPKGGFYVWADDAVGRYKRLLVGRSEQGWRLTFVTENNAPWAGLKACSSVRWRIGAYTGDWRAAAKRYRDWMARTWALKPLKQQSPSWVADIRTAVTMGADLPTLEALARRVDARQTLLYLPGWRKSEYDRMYPDYEAAPGFTEFVNRAHALGFRVMVHCNYFGCDPKSPEYAEFAPVQVRNPGSHALEWWTKDADPPIRFAYINPASKAWRKLLVQRLKEVVTRYRVDALHLDQTFCIYNDDNGLVDGMTMLQGNIALQREVHEALPEVAISGEGLDEVTLRSEAFAQRHSYGLDFVRNTWHRPALSMAHPISSYLFHAYTQPYGYGGMVPPMSSQTYSAWRENYKHWAVLPNIAWPTAPQLDAPTGFLRLALDESRAFTRHHLDPDPDRPWPADVCFPYKGDGGVTASYREDALGTLFDLEQGGVRTVVSRCITGVREAALPGSIDGWRCYDAARLLGLDPDRWYAHSTTPRDPAAVHVFRLPEAARPGHIEPLPFGFVLEMRSGPFTALRLADLMGRARSGSIPGSGKPTTVDGPLYDSRDGALFMPNGADIHAHPPWRQVESGIAWTEIPLDVPDAPGDVRFVTQIAMDKGAVGPDRTDGVLYAAKLVGSGAQAQVFTADADPNTLTLDLTPFKGKTAVIRLEVDPGPKRNPSFDWARWYGPRVEVSGKPTGLVGLAGAPPFAAALSGAGEIEVQRTPEGALLEMEMPGSVYLLKERPAPSPLPQALSAGSATVSFIGDDGAVLTSPQYASYAAGSRAVGGQERTGIAAHPPDHGRTIAQYALTLPGRPARFHAWVGVRDGSKSDGCLFILQANGREVARVRKVPGRWSEISANLAPWAGKTVVLAVVTDSDGPSKFDWAVWAEPRIVAK